MGLFSFLKARSNEPKGLLAYLGLGEWFTSLAYEEQQKVREYFNGLGWEPKDLDTTNYSFSSTTQSKFFNGIAHRAMIHKDYVFSEKVFLESLHSKQISVIDRHFTYNNLIDLYYKQRESSPEAITKCVYFCLEDIEIVEEFLHVFDSPIIPRIPSIQRLIIIYEKQGKFEEAIKICNIALKLGLNDKSGFEGRIEKIRKKLDYKEKNA